MQKWTRIVTVRLNKFSVTIYEFLIYAFIAFCCVQLISANSFRIFLTNNNDRNLFIINLHKFVLFKVGGDVDFEDKSQYVVTIIAADAAAKAEFKIQVPLKIEDVNEAPENLKLSQKKVRNTSREKLHSSTL